MVREFVSAPFLTCPDCKQEGAFGVLMVCGRHYVRRCVKCWFDAGYPLPPLNKKVIYLDQFVISNMMKELDRMNVSSSKRSHAEFFQELFEILDRLCKLQLIVCPDSQVHQNESVVTGTYYKKLRAIYLHFSHEASLLPPESILNIQLQDGFSRWLNKQDVLTTIDRQRGFRSEFNKWTDRIRLDMNFTVPGLAEELNTVSKYRTKQLHEVCQYWQTMPKFSFKEILGFEIEAQADGILKQFAHHSTAMMRAQQGLAPVSDVAFPSPGANLVLSLLCDLAESTLDISGRLELISSFLKSKHFKNAPYVRLTALFWATLARDVRAGRSPDNFPDSSIYNDIDVVAGYAPYCDAMLVDNQIEHLSRQGLLANGLSCCARIFALRSSDEFLEYLRDIERHASQEHVDKVKEVYGSNVGKPFLDLLKHVK